MDKFRKTLKFISIICIFAILFANNTFAAVPEIVEPLAGDPVYPVFRQPILYDEIPYGKSFTFQWYAPTSGTVSHYLFSLRKLKYKDSAADELLYSNVQVNTKIYTVAAGELEMACYYRAAVGAVMSTGSTKWTTINFYCASGRGIQDGNVISFKIGNFPSVSEKDAIYYSTQTWKNVLGTEKVNTYPYTMTPSTTTLNNSDYENSILPVTSGISQPMTTYKRLNPNNGYIVEVDILRNENKSWGSSGYDTQGLMAHEMGHALGLCDKYETFATEWTMYGKTTAGETKKRSLHSYDIQSITRLYELN